ncbi:AAA family ATPase [Nocardioides sp. CPCC 206347]|uniref:AAA family ATPase n=1 Tax=unclassified Nocardioides TaxID=2615069 RepID=UPI003614E205
MSAKSDESTTDQISISRVQFVQLAALAAASDKADAPPLLRRLARSLRDVDPPAAQALVSILRAAPVRSATGAVTSEPVDQDSRLPLLRREDPVMLQVEPILETALREELEQIAAEHEQSEALYTQGLAPTRTALLVGPPGVGKTLAARWMARRLEKPLLVLDLASVMSSFLGRTGTNIHRVFEHARTTPCVFLLDELDAVAKRRDDSTEIGELKRLVTVLLQEIDRWPDGSLLLAATNHAELLDPAVWRRFEATLNFSYPTLGARRSALGQLLAGESLDPGVAELVVEASAGASLSTLESDVQMARRKAVLRGRTLDDELLDAQRRRIETLPTTDRVRLATNLMAGGGLSQRRVSQLTGVSRDTLRKHSDERGQS